MSLFHQFHQSDPHTVNVSSSPSTGTNIHFLCKMWRTDMIQNILKTEEEFYPQPGNAVLKRRTTFQRNLTCGQKWKNQQKQTYKQTNNNNNKNIPDSEVSSVDVQSGHLKMTTTTTKHKTFFSSFKPRHWTKMSEQSRPPETGVSVDSTAVSTENVNENKSVWRVQVLACNLHLSSSACFWFLMKAFSFIKGCCGGVALYSIIIFLSLV